MVRYKLVRIVGGRYLSANQEDLEPQTPFCFEYKVGEVTKIEGYFGVACYKRKKDAVTPAHIKETRYYFNKGDPIALLSIKPLGRRVYTDGQYRKGGCYEGGINYRSVEVLKATELRG